MRTALLVLAVACLLPARAAEPSPWPDVTRENKPWTRWWWPGSGVDRPNLTHQLEAFAAAGLGGVEITPIYGAKGAEARYVDFLSPAWVDLVAHTAAEAKRLGLGVDMATGTGWPFGGPWIDADHGSQKATLREGRIIPEPTRMKVKRAAPGDEGLVVDPYSPNALRRYLAPFEPALGRIDRGLIRGQFHDSFEYYGASWTAGLPEAFRARHGYDIQAYAAELLAKPADVKRIDADTLGRVKSDYRETLADLHLQYLRTWVQWSHERGYVVRNQSHGAPGNLLDLYANADIPETEIFGSTPFPIPGLRRDAADVRHDQDLPESLVIRMASSAAHVAGRPLASSESCTWLREHFKETPAFAKPELDRILADGINHIFYHGTVYSPQDAAWPGWLFYASTQINPNNPLWSGFGELNRYIARVQSVLQRGRPDNEVLLYWPVADLWDDAGGLMHQLSVHDVKWLTEQPVGRLARTFLDRGYAFDYVSDAQLAETRTEGGRLVTPGGAYRVLVVPAARRMSAATLRRIADLAAAGATVLFQRLPEDVPGLGRLEARRADFQAARRDVAARRLERADLPAALAAAGVAREPLAEQGISVIRRASDRGHDYFLANLTGRTLDGWAPLGTDAADAVLLDPISGSFGAAAVRKSATGGHEAYLQLAPGESLLLRTGQPAAHRARWPYRRTAGAPVALSGDWSVTFLRGGPELPPAYTAAQPSSWTARGGAAEAFAGTARYTLRFDLPAGPADDWRLDLGDVREAARVRVNGLDAGAAWSVPFHLRVGTLLRPGRNELEIEVTSLAANRIRDLDRRGVTWRIMREINFVNINYKPFDASGWQLAPSGLLGPVTLTPLRALQP